MTRKLLILVVLVFGAYQAKAQDPLTDYVLEERGDTLVIADYFDAGGVTNTLGAVIAAETAMGNVPAGRVYMLRKGANGDLASGNQALYLNDAVISEQSRPITIVGEYCGLMVQGDDPNCRPPTVSGFTDAAGAGVVSTIAVNGDLTLKNLYWTSAHNLGQSNWSLVDVNGNNLTITWENVMMEHNRWTWINSNGNYGTKLVIKDSYFLNATDQNSRRNGGVFDADNPTGEVWVENSTHVQNMGMQYKFRSFSPDRVWFNHNTFVNASGQLFLGFGYLTNFVVTNNLFVNSNYQPYWPGVDNSEMYATGTTTAEFQPHGIINLNYLPRDESGNTYVNDVASAENGAVTPFNEADRKVLVDLNAAYWDPMLLTIADDLNAAGLKGDICEGDGCVQDASLNWVNGALLANERTTSMFNDDATYPLLTWGQWYDEDPMFTDGPGMVQELYDWGYASANSGVTVQEVLPKIRQAGNEAGNEIDTEDTNNWIVFDWPVAVDLSYSNATYLSGGFMGYPLGDLNWFPERKAQWLADRDAEIAAITAALDNGSAISTAVEQIGAELPTSARLKQNYPNPFNPATRIEFELAQAGTVQLTVYDVLGRRVATLVNEQLAPGTYSVDWNATNEVGKALTSGLYFYTLRAGNVVETRQMMLLK